MQKPLRPSAGSTSATRTAGGTRPTPPSRALAEPRRPGLAWGEWRQSSGPSGAGSRCRGARVHRGGLHWVQGAALSREAHGVLFHWLYVTGLADAMAAPSAASDQVTSCRVAPPGPTPRSENEPESAPAAKRPRDTSGRGPPSAARENRVALGTPPHRSPGV